MTNCNHPYLTIDWVCKMCGYDLVVDANNDKIRKQEQERIIKLLENYAGKECGFGIEHDLIELIKGENK